MSGGDCRTGWTEGAQELENVLSLLEVQLTRKVMGEISVECWTYITFRLGEQQMHLSCVKIHDSGYIEWPSFILPTALFPGSFNPIISSSWFSR